MKTTKPQLQQVPPVPQVLGLTPLDQSAAESPTLRARNLYNREVAKNVELSRKFSRMERNFASTRNHVTNVCHYLKMVQGMKPIDPIFMNFRNAIRAMKGKNLL
jgi:hypothetical protein